MVKDLFTIELTRSLVIFVAYNLLRIMTRMITDNSVLGHIRFLGILYNFWNDYIIDICP